MHAFIHKPKADQQNLLRRFPNPNQKLSTPRILSSGEQSPGGFQAALMNDFSHIPLHPRPPCVQAKLNISTPGDIHEQEADQVAEHVMRMPAPRKILGRRTLQQHPFRQVESVGISEGSPIARKVLSAPGQVMDGETRRFMEVRFGHDFGHVRVHAGPEAERSVMSLGAAAYTLGSHVVYGKGQTPGKNALTAHELTHVIQQTGGNSVMSPRIQRQITPLPGVRATVGPIADAAESLGCLIGLLDEMSRQSWWYLRTACREGHYMTSQYGVHFIPESWVDAFGHCWIACQGTHTCGEEATQQFGEGHEVFREFERTLSLGLSEHNSLEEDLFNQAYGRLLGRNNPGGDCANLCYQAVSDHALRFHLGSSSEDSGRPRVYNCSDITLGGHLYPQGWRSIPMEYLERF